MAYIDKSRAIGMLERFREEHSNLPNACLKMIDVALNIIKQIPTADVVEAVRRKDCKKRNTDDCWISFYNEDGELYCDTRNDDFCSYGERSDT